VNDIIGDADGITDNDVIKLLTSTTPIQTQNTGDVCGSLGIFFPGVVHPGEKRSFMIIIGVGATYDEAASIVKQTILNPNSVREDPDLVLNVFPQPAEDIVHISHMAGVERIVVTDITGTEVYSSFVNSSEQNTVLTTRTLSPGVYACTLYTRKSITYMPLVISR